MPAKKFENAWPNGYWMTADWIGELLSHFIDIRLLPNIDWVQVPVRPPPWHEEGNYFFIVLWAHTLLKKALPVPPAFSFHPFPSSCDTCGICYKNQILEVLFGIYILSWTNEWLLPLNWGMCDFWPMICVGVLFPLKT